MPAHTTSRLLFAGLTLALALGLVVRPAEAMSSFDWTETVREEEVFVRACDDFDITSSYIAVRDYHVVTDVDQQPVSELREVNFGGDFANSETGESFAYLGKYAHTINYANGDLTTSAISDLDIQLALPMAGMINLSIARLDQPLADEPPAIVFAVAPHQLMEDLCALLGGSTPRVAGDPPPGQPADPPSAVPDPCDIQPQDPARQQCSNPCILDGTCPPEGITL
jgi:hypothetical protein